MMMARKKKDETPPAKQLGRPPDPRGPLRHILSFKERPSYKKWLDELRVHGRYESMSDLIHDAFAGLAKRKKFRSPPKDDDKPPKQ
jgi:hypothetical protein